MPVTVHPPLTAPSGTADIVLSSGADWKLGGGGSLQVIAATTATVAEFASGQWGWVETT